MAPHFSVSIGLIVFMGLVSGGMLALLLMAPRRQHASYSVILGLATLMAAGGVAGSAIGSANLVAALANAFVLVILSFALGYSLTTFSVLSPARVRHSPRRPRPASGQPAVLLLASGEPPEYSVRETARRLEFADDPGDVPPLLLRPFYMHDVKSKYAAIGTSPYRAYCIELAAKVQARLEGTHRVYMAFYNDQPSLAEILVSAIEDGAHQVLVVPMRVSNLPDSIRAGDLLEGIRPDLYGLTIDYLPPAWDSDLLPQIYVRRVLEAVPQVDSDPDEVGLLLVGRGHGAEPASAMNRRKQEEGFQRHVRQALRKAGFQERQIATGWLRIRPTAADALAQLIAAGCKHIFWMPSTYLAEGLSTLYDVRAQISGVAAKHGVRLETLGAWNADDLAAEELAVRIKLHTHGITASRVL